MKKYLAVAISLIFSISVFAVEPVIVLSDNTEERLSRTEFNEGGDQNENAAEEEREQEDSDGVEPALVVESYVPDNSIETLVLPEQNTTTPDVGSFNNDLHWVHAE